MKSPAPAAPVVTPHAWQPRPLCDASCVSVGDADASRPVRVALRVALRIVMLLLLAPGFLLIMVQLPGQVRVQRIWCRLMLRCFGVRMTVTGSPIRNLRGVLVVSGHTSWVDIFVIGALLPGSFVARADMFSGRATGIVARGLKLIPIERSSLRGLPAVVDAAAARLGAGHTVVCFPQGTTWCGLASGPFYPALFQAAIDAGRPVQPLRLSYHHVDGTVSTVPAYVGDETLLQSLSRVLTVRRTLARVHVESLQLPGTDRRALARRCQTAVGAGSPHHSQQQPGRKHALAA